MEKNSERKRGFSSPEEAQEAVGRFVNSHIRMRRMLSGVIDFVLFCFPVALIIRVIMKLYESGGHGTEHEGFRVLIDNPLCAAVLVLIFMLKDTFRSPGKRLMRLKLVAADGGKPPFWKRALRNVTIVVSQIEAIVIIFTGRRLTDWILGLNVVDAEEKESANGEKQL